MLVILINISIFIIYKNSSNLINTRSDTTSVLYFCKTICKDYSFPYKHFNNGLVYQIFLKKYPLNNLK